MKKFVLTTISVSSDHYIYFIEHPQMPTKKEIKAFLLENGNDVNDYNGKKICYEHMDDCVEITEFERIP